MCHNLLAIEIYSFPQRHRYMLDILPQTNVIHGHSKIGQCIPHSQDAAICKECNLTIAALLRAKTSGYFQNIGQS